MRNGQNNKRMRNRNSGNNNRRGGQNPMTRVFESNGPDIKIRGTASHVAEKYVQLARDARSSGDPVAAENYYQHAEHYFRLIAAAQEQFRQNQPQPRPDAEVSPDDGEDEGDGFSHFGQEPGFVPVQPQPFMREGGQRDHQREGQSYHHREHHQPREHREHRGQPQFQPQHQPQPNVPDVGGLPSFITGPQPQPNAGQGGFEGGERERDRFPRRRRRPHGPRSEGPATPGEDLNPGNE
jgi:uncharacterized protein DUF4167